MRSRLGGCFGAIGHLGIVVDGKLAVPSPKFPPSILAHTAWTALGLMEALAL